MNKLRMYYHILGTEVYYKEVTSPEEAKTMIDAIADFINTKIYEGVFPDHCSTAGLEYFDEEEEELFMLVVEELIEKYWSFVMENLRVLLKYISKILLMGIHHNITSVLTAEQI